ncbi:MAG: alpha-L-fucosidase [Acidobacteriota bacterium]
MLTRREFALSMVAALTANNRLSILCPAQEKPQPNRGDWFREARFGLFIHFGLYSTYGRGEWIMRSENIPYGEYENLATKFNPTKFKAREWVALAKAAGQRYITITTKHHDGFCLFESRLTDYHITRTPFGRDLIKELADECHRQNMPIFFYYSLMDWHHPAYQSSVKSGSPVTNEFIAYLKGQIRELCTNYGRVAGFWFDGDWDHTSADWHSQEILNLIYQLQPQALVNNRTGLPADFSTYEQEIGAKPKAIDNHLREACMTINDNWGYAVTDGRYKSAAELIQLLALAANSDSNLLLNVAPKPTGEIQSEFITRLYAVGNWLKQNGEAIYGTRAALRSYNYNTATTARGNKLYFHIFNWQPNTGLSLDLVVKRPIKKVYILESGAAFPFRRKSVSDDGKTEVIRFEAKNRGWSSANTVIVIESGESYT